jgi:hypothetical protein
MMIESVAKSRLTIPQVVKAYDVHKHVVAALEECVNVTNSEFPNLYSNTQPGLSASSKQSIRMCLKKSERNILIFVVRLHYAVSICNAFRSASERKDLPKISFDFETFPELKLVLIELEFDRECAVKCTNRKKTVRIKNESDLVNLGEHDLIERLDELESNLTREMRKTLQDFIKIVVPKID